MLGEKKCTEILKSALKHAQSVKPDYVEFLIVSWENYVTRVANSQIHQNVAETEAMLAVDVIHNLRIGSASTSVMSLDSIRNAVDVAIASTRHKAQLPGGLSLEEFPKGARKGKISEKTAAFTPQDRARVVKTLIDQAASQHLTTSARFQTGVGEIAIANSLGTFVYTNYTDANLSAILTGTNDSAYRGMSSQDVSELDIDRFASELIGKCRLQNRPPVDLFAGRKPGEELYLDVILEPAAVGEWLDFLGFTGFNGLSYLEEDSFLCGKLGQKVMGENVTIWDDGNDPAGYILPFDFEGTLKRKVMFIEQGIGRNVAFDGLLATKGKAKSTGHSLGAGQRHNGAIPLNLFMEGGEQSLDYMIASSEEPTLYVTRFHYTNIADIRNVVLTGMTKDGTFLVEKGEIVAPAANLRYLQGVVDAFNRIDMLSDPCRVHDPEGYGALIPSCSVAPALRIKHVRFVGSSGEK
jgi:predicted Zn-dependent protease